MRVCVTGSSGQLGSHVVDMLVQSGSAVLGVDVVESPWTARQEDIRDLREPLECDAIVHCAAQVSVARSVEQPRHDASINIDGTLSLLELARRQDVARFVFISSAAVYGAPMEVPIREDAPLRPVSPYGLSKAVGESYTRMYEELYGLKAVVLRPFNIFSPRQDPRSPYSGVISCFAEAVSAGNAITIFGDGLQTRDFVHISDVVQAVHLALASPDAAGKTFNVGTGKGTAITALARIVMDLSGTDVPIRSAPARQGDIRHSVADIAALARLGYRPTTRLHTHLKELLAPEDVPDVAARGVSAMRS